MTLARGIRNACIPSLILWALIVWGVLALAGCGEETGNVDRSSWRTIPPERHEMSPVLVTMAFNHPDEIQRICGRALGLMNHWVGCCISGVIYVPHPMFWSGPDYDVLLRHELGHCPGGWPANHEG